MWGYKQTNVAGEAPFDVPVIQRGRLRLELWNSHGSRLGMAISKNFKVLAISIWCSCWIVFPFTYVYIYIYAYIIYILTYVGGWRRHSLSLVSPSASRVGDTVDGFEILLQLIGDKHPIIFRASTIEGGAGFLPSTVFCYWCDWCVPLFCLWCVPRSFCLQGVLGDAVPLNKCVLFSHGLCHDYRG